ncbi:haloacid dehalogenase-like hydrolase family protein [Zea mays]|uniref:Haloacid dehalogenase-like hydrolase family protein n=1 Tax=Zea mays TaxID=4577 RepID=A0A1D6H6L2_MAIZE|nr:haloacid dehalogenase-like hydrolase family protein [Zea mays]
MITGSFLRKKCGIVGAPKEQNYCSEGCKNSARITHTGDPRRPDATCSKMLRMAQSDGQVGKKLHHQTRWKLMSTRTHWTRPRRNCKTRSFRHLVYCKSPCDTRVLHEVLSCKALPFNVLTSKGRSLCGYI